MAQVYATEFSEQELKDLATFYKSPLGQKLILTSEPPRRSRVSMAYMNEWAHDRSPRPIDGEFRSEMKKRNKPL